MKNKKKKSRMAADIVSQLTAIAEYIMTYTLESLIGEFDALLVALFLSSSDETDQFLARGDRPDAHRIASEVKVYHEDPKALARGAATGFFGYELGCLLEIAKRNRIASARFTPIFFTALLNARELGLSEEVQETLKQHVEYQKKLDGFAVLNADDKFAILVDNEVIPL